MTKYILNSGGLSLHLDKTKKFIAEIVKNLNNNPHVLLCLFAQPREDWEEKLVKYSENYNQLMPAEVTPTFQLAMPDTFGAQIEKADAIIIQGGDDHLLQYWLKQFDIPKIWEGKTIATNSAGSDVLVKHFWTCDWRQCMDGLGILPIKFIPHFKSNFGSDDPRGPIDWAQAYEELKKYGDQSLPIHALKEGEYIVVEV